MDDRMGKGGQAWRSTDTPHKNNLWALHTGHTLERDPAISFVLVIGFGVGTSIRTQSHRNVDWGKLLGGQEVPCPHGFDSSRRFSQQEHTRPAWSGRA